MTTPVEIHLYDAPSKLSDKAWSPNPWKIRYALNYMKIPYRTIWVEYPEIAPACIKIGAPPSRMNPDGSPYYSVPTIYDPNTGKAISDSEKIMEYLESTYPSPPERSLVPAGTWPLQLAFIHAIFTPSVILPLLPFAITRSTMILNEVSVPHFLEARKPLFGGRSLAEVEPKGESRATEWKKVEEGFGIINSWTAEQKGTFLMGDRVIYVDFVVAGLVRWIRLIFGEDSEEWRSVKTWHGGRWERLVNELEQYTTVV
ncbi:hypothetical protein V5O48_010845 [Marasmius crinis-equi]|uniref:GST N-terminal domain-containing protein n=1 Tax=Marasmius crinis-equi TaxID=585013 RepID=A0ABR3F781_9AGAR